MHGLNVFKNKIFIYLKDGKNLQALSGNILFILINCFFISEVIARHNDIRYTFNIC